MAVSVVSPPISAPRRRAPPPAPEAPPDRPPPSVGIEGPTDARRAVPLTPHPSFAQVLTLSFGEVRQFYIKQAALRIAAGLEDRSLRELAKEIGCSHQALDKALIRLCEVIGLRKYHTPDGTRDKLRSSRLRFLASRDSIGAPRAKSRV